MITLEETVRQQRKDIHQLQNLSILQTRKLKQYHELHQACKELEIAYGVNKIHAHNAISRIKRALGALRRQEMTYETLR